MITSLVTLFLVSLSQDTPRDFKLPVMPVREFASWLEQETGREVIILPQVKEKLLYINVKQRTFADLFSLVQQATGLEVLDKNGVLTIRPAPGYSDSSIVTVEGLQATLDKVVVPPKTESDFRKMVPEFLRIQDKMRKGGLRPDDPDYKIYEEAIEFDPCNLALKRILKSFGALALAQLPMYERVVFSTHPTRLQRPWPVSASPEMKQITEAQTLRNRLVEELVPPNPPEESSMYYGPSISFLSAQGGELNPVAAMNLIFKREMMGIMVELKCFDKGGMLIGQTSYNLMGQEMEIIQSSLKSLTESTKDLDKKFQFTESEKKDFQRLTSLYGGFSPNTVESREDMEWLAQVDVNEPMSGVFSRMLDFALGEINSECVSEIFMPMLQNDVESGFTAGEILAGLCFQSFGGLFEAQRNGLIVGKPVPTWVYQFVVSRPSHANVARAILRNGRLTLEDLCFSVKELSSEEQLSTFVGSALSLSGQQDQSYIQPRGWESFILHIYSMLSPTERKALFSDEGLRLDIAKVRPDVRDLFWQTALWNDIGIPSEYVEVRPGEYERKVSGGGFVDTDWKQEPTVFLTDPLALPTIVTLRGLNQSGFVVNRSYQQDNGASYENMNFETIESYASTKLWQEYAPKNENYVHPQVLGLTSADRVYITVSVSFGKLNIGDRSFSMLNSRLGKLSEEGKLPVDVQEKLAKATASMRDLYKNRQQQIPPP